MENYCYLFEKVFKGVFGRPKTPIYFAGYCDMRGDKHKYILYTLCIYVLNYRNITDEEKEVLERFTSEESIFFDDKEIEKMLIWLEKRYSLV